VKKGERVILSWPMIPEACFAISPARAWRGPFGRVRRLCRGQPRRRIDDAKPALMITGDGGSAWARRY